jgi:hypothetical protein
MLAEVGAVDALSREARARTGDVPKGLLDSMAVRLMKMITRASCLSIS